VPDPSAPVEPVTSAQPPDPIHLPPPNSLQPPERWLSPVAFREGRIELASWAGRPFAVIDGEPIPLAAGRVVERDPSLAVGLMPDKIAFASSHELVAFGGTYVVYAEHFERSSSRYFDYVRAHDRWSPIEQSNRGGDPRVETHYGAFVETGGALLGLRRHVIQSELWDYGDEDDPSMTARLRKVGRELSQAPRGFVVLAGSPKRVPALPKGWDASDAVATASGELVALGFRHRTSFDGEHGPARVLSWAAGASEAVVSELPGLRDPSIHELGIWATGDAVLVGGLRELPNADDQPYLAVRGRDGSFAEVELPAVDERVASATITPNGELWIVTGGWNYARERPCECLWRKPVDGAWEEVELGLVSLFRDDEQRWAHVLTEQSWFEVPPGSPPRLYPAARAVMWAGEAIWVTAELGPSYPTASERVLADPRTVLFSSMPVEPRELIATDQLFDERIDRRVAASNFTPGANDCRTFHMVVADDPDGAGQEFVEQLLARVEQLRKHATIDNEDGWASANLVYVGELDGRAQLIIEANGWNSKSARALVDGFAQILGRPLALDCRPRKLLRLVERLQVARRRR
jgi:hypothetical protein